MTRASSRPAPPIPLWMIALLLALAALRLPAFVEPAGHDQSLYLYIGQRLLDGGVPYVDAWDQKPPLVYGIYAALWIIWPYESVVALADLLGAAVTAYLLVGIGRRTFGGRTGGWAAAVFLLGSHPSLTRLSGVYVRGQCEVFIAAAVAAALFVLAHERRTIWRSLLAGLWLGIAIWIKFNAVAYALPIAIAAWHWDSSSRDLTTWLKDLIVVATGVAIVSAVAMTYFAAHNGIEALKLATIDYNVSYAREGFVGTSGPLAYLFRLPIERASAELLWFLGGAGAAALLLAGRGVPRGSSLVVLGWIAAALVSITINARNLPQYFVQAAPALACAAAIGGAWAMHRSAITRWLAMAVIAAGLWRVGVSPNPIRFGEMPELAANLAFDVNYLRGRMSRQDFLARFKGAQKYDALEVDRLTSLVRTTTAESDRIFVFGFSPGVYAFSGRESASRFFWSRPVIIEFAAARRGYGSTGLLHDLQQRPPALVALQKQDWGGPGEPHSHDFFLANTGLRLWLESGYTRESESSMFSVWRRKS